MTATTVPVLSADRSSSTASLWKGAGLGVLTGGAAVMAVATIASGVDVPLEIAGEAIPAPGFATAVAMSTVAGTLLAMLVKATSARPRARWTAIAVALTAVSCVPSVTAEATTATRVVLVITHLVAAAIVIPMVARRLPAIR